MYQLSGEKKKNVISFQMRKFVKKIKRKKPKAEYCVFNH